MNIDLRIEIKDGHAQSILTFSNNSNKDLYLIKMLNCIPDRIKSDAFEIYQGKERLAYMGPMIKRKPFEEKDFVKLSPNEKISTTVMLDEAYDFMTGEYAYEAFFESSFYEKPDIDSKEIKIASNRITFKFRK